MKAVKVIMSLIFYIVAIYLIFEWYDWKLLLILVLFVSANNIERTNLKQTNEND